MLALPDLDGTWAGIAALHCIIRIPPPEPFASKGNDKLRPALRVSAPLPPKRA